MTSRPHGVLASAAGLIPFGHLGWGFSHRREFRRRAAEYLTDGVRQGQYVVLVCGGTTRSMMTELAAVREEMSQDVADAPVELTHTDDFYAYVSGTNVVDPETSVAERVAATEHAVAEGFTGFRAVVDATGVARTEAQRTAFGRFEILVDQQMVRFPVSALCAYDRTELDDATDLVCLHPYVNAEGAAHQIFAAPDADVAVTGAVDADCDAAFVDAVFTAIGPAREAVTVDASGADHIAAECVRRLDGAARRDGRLITLMLRSSASDALDERLSNVRIVPCEAPTADSAGDAALQTEISQLRNRLASQPVIEQCKGMLMSAFGLTAEDAFELMKSLSQNGNLKLRDAAHALVDEWRVDGPRPDYDAATAFLQRARDATTSGPG